MTSAISVSPNPFKLVAQSKEPITAKLVREAVAGAPKDLDVSEDAIYRDLHEIVSTRAFGDNTPALADDAAARVASLAPAEKAGGFNNTAAAFAEVLTVPLAAGAIYASAHALSAAVTGAVVALEAELAAKTDEQKTDKAAIIEGFKGGITTYESLQLYSGLWSALAEPAGEGTFAVPHAIVGPLTQSIAAQEITPELKTFLEGKLASLNGSKGATAEPTAEEIEAKKALIQRELTRPIGGKGDTELEALYKDVSAKAKIQRITLRPERFRPEKYQKLIDVLNESPSTPILVPILKEIIAKHNVDTRRLQKAAYTEISADNASTVDDKQLQAVRNVALDVAERMGAGDPSVTRVAQAVLNAWVSSVDLDQPHITYFSHLQDIVWDREKGDWLKFHVDEKGEICEADAPGAREISGEGVVGVVFAHELAHISEGAVLNQYLMSILLGASFRADPAKGHGDGCVCSGCANVTDPAQAALADKIMGDPRIKQLLRDPGFKNEQLKLAKSFGIDSIIQAKHAAESAATGSAGAQDNSAAKAPANALEDFFLMYTREGESAADYCAVLAYGLNAPRFMAVAFDIVNRTTGNGSPGERLAAFKESYLRDHRAVNEAKLEYSEEGGAVSHAAIATQTTHPTAILRAIANYDFAERPSTQAIWDFQKAPPRLRLLGAAQAVDSEIERLEDEHEDYQRGSQNHMAPEEIMKTLERVHNRSAIRGQYERMRIVTGEIAKLVFDDGLHLDDESTPYAVFVAQFIKQGGIPLFRHAGDSNPLAALLGGGDGPAPACVKMAGQLADELERIVNAAELGDKEHAQWQSIINIYRKFADEGGEQVHAARSARMKGKVATRTLRGRT